MTDHIKDGVILTVGGVYFSLVNPTEDQVDVYDIAYALSSLCRYTGHTNKFYSVAEHSVRCASYLRKRGYSPKAQMAALLHDAAEAYIGDVSSPLKALLPEYRAIENRVSQAIVDKFGVDWRGRAEVHMADMQLLCTERHELFDDQTPWDVLDGMDPAEYQHTTALGWTSGVANAQFIKAFFTLQRECEELYGRGDNL